MIFGNRVTRGAAWLAWVVVGGLPAASGCSYIFVTSPKDQDGITVAADCTQNVAAPVIDTILTTTNVLSMLYVASENNVTNKGQALGVGALVTGMWLSSAIYGYYNTRRCAELREGDEGAYRPRPRRIRRTVLSGPPRLAPTPTAPPAYPVSAVGGAGGEGGAGGAGSAGGSALPASPAHVAPAPIPGIRQQRDEDDPN